MASEIGRRPVIAGIAAAVGAGALSASSSLAAPSGGYLVRGPKGEYYFVGTTELPMMTATGQCKITDCVAINTGQSKTIVYRASLDKHYLQSADPLANQIPDAQTLAQLDKAIKARQALAKDITQRLRQYGVAPGGTYTPTKKG